MHVRIRCTKYEVVKPFLAVDNDNSSCASLTVAFILALPPLPLH